MSVIAYLTNDLLFSSRVASLAKSMGVDLRIIRNREALVEISKERLLGIFIDLEHPEALTTGEWRHDPTTSAVRPTTVAYGPHVKTDLFAAAQTAGIDYIWTRGQFDKQAGQMMQLLVAGEKPT